MLRPEALAPVCAIRRHEKVVKSYILEKGGSHSKVHHLEELCACASTLGLPPVDPALVAVIQCKPDVRYDSRLVTKDQALAAYDAALIVCGATARYIRRTTAEAGVASVRISINGRPPGDGLILEYQPPVPPFFTTGTESSHSPVGPGLRVIPGTACVRARKCNISGLQPCSGAARAFSFSRITRRLPTARATSRADRDFPSIL
jgi:hypothetical protein